MDSNTSSTSNPRKEDEIEEKVVQPISLDYLAAIKDTLFMSPNLLGIAQLMDSSKFQLTVSKDFKPLPNDAYVLVPGNEIKRILKITKCQDFECFNAIERKDFSQLRDVYERFSSILFF